MNSTRLARMTEEFASAHQQGLLALGEDLEWHVWTQEHLLAERPGKWIRSVVALDSDDQPCGYAVASEKGRAVHIHQIIVGAEARAGGIGRSLVAHVVEQARHDGFASVTLSVLARNQRAIRFYENLGFTISDGTEEDREQVLMQLALRPAAHTGPVVAIHQPNFAPWGGFFAKVAKCDVFVLLDDVQMPRGRSWVHRSRIQVRGEPHWLSVPCIRSSDTLINEVRLADEPWPAKHLKTLDANYGRAPFFDDVMSLISPLYQNTGEWLADFNISLISAVADHLGLAPAWIRSSEISARGTGQERIISLVTSLGGRAYLSGPGAEAYQTAEAFEQAGVDLIVKRYEPVPYAQSQPGFVPGLSVLDALFHCGRDTTGLLTYP
jgi:GNAT superfamily N-acetyltransferase